MNLGWGNTGLGFIAGLIGGRYSRRACRLNGGYRLVCLDLVIIFAMLSSIDERLLSVRLLIDETLLEVYEEKERWNRDDRND